MKKLIFPIVSLFILFPTMIVLIALFATGKVTLSYQGLAADKYGNVYIGKGAEINVYDLNGDYVRSIHITAGEGGDSYNFTILEGETIVVDSGAHFEFMDLYGNVIKEMDLIDMTELDYVPWFTYLYSQTKFTAVDGSVYKMVNAFDGTKVFRINGNEVTTVYTAPIGDAIAPIAFGVCMIWALAVALYCVIYGRKMLGFKDYEWGGFL